MEEKVKRLQKILAEARELIEDIERDARKYSAKEYSDIAIEAVDMPDASHKSRIIHALWAEGIHTIGDLVKHSPYQIKHLKNAGKITVEELQETLLKQYGINWE